MGFEDLLGESINQVLIFYQQDVMLFIKAAGNVMLDQFTSGRLLATAKCGAALRVFQLPESVTL